MIKVIRMSKASVNFDYCGREVRVSGDLSNDGFRALADTMTWMLAHSRQEPVTEHEKYKVMKAVTLYYKGQKNRVYFVDDKGNELKLKD